MTETRAFGGAGYAVVEQALVTAGRYGMLTSGDVVVAAVSGGPDSTCMLDVLRRIGAKLDLGIEVAHVDHGLGADSEKIAAAVAASAAAAGLEVHVVRAPDLSGPNLHARARDFRYGFFDMVADRIGATRVATGHTIDDRAETLLARLLHGAPTETLAGISPVEGTRVRPLIEVRRAETRAYCDDVGLGYHADPANEDPRFERPRVRAGLMAVVEAQWGDGAVRAMARSAEHLRVDARALAELSDRLYARLARPDESEIRFALETLEPVPRALRRRLLDLAVGRVRDRSGGIEAALDALEEGPRPGARFAVAGGSEIVVDPPDLVVRRPPVRGDDRGDILEP